MADFLEWIDLPEKLPKRAETQGLGRNCTMFEKCRHWAYRQVLNYRLLGDRKGFADAVLKHCESINNGFPSPLNFSEVRSTAKSISTWTWKHYTSSGSMSAEDWAKYVADTHTTEKQRARQAKQVAKRQEATKTARQQAKEMRQGGSTLRAIATALDVPYQTIHRWLKTDWRKLHRLPRWGNFFDFGLSHLPISVISPLTLSGGVSHNQEPPPSPCKGSEAPRK